MTQCSIGKPSDYYLFSRWYKHSKQAWVLSLSSHSQADSKVMWQMSLKGLSTLVMVCKSRSLLSMFATTPTISSLSIVAVLLHLWGVVCLYTYGSSLVKQRLSQKNEIIFFHNQLTAMIVLMPIYYDYIIQKTNNNPIPFRYQYEGTYYNVQFSFESGSNMTTTP